MTREAEASDRGLDTVGQKRPPLGAGLKGSPESLVPYSLGGYCCYPLGGDPGAPHREIYGPDVYPAPIGFIRAQVTNHARMLAAVVMSQGAGRAFCSARFAYPQQQGAFPRLGRATVVRRQKLKWCRSRSAPVGGTDCNLNPLPEPLVRHYNL